mmetsp:Transcript_86170/g.165865  ORF Transcript_86170/g.165865 Transcript_86170/m.165865 type:complete len:85 (+) Transcript_86170:1552-1806(+)
MHHPLMLRRSTLISLRTWSFVASISRFIGLNGVKPLQVHWPQGSMETPLLSVVLGWSDARVAEHVHAHPWPQGTLLLNHNKDVR